MSLLATRVAELVAEYPNNLDRDELREQKYGLLMSAKQQTASPDSILSNDVKAKADNSMATDLEVPVYVKDEITLGTQRRCVIGDFENTTAKVLVLWNTMTADISMVEAQYINQRMSYLEDLNRKLRLVDEAFAKNAESLIFTAIENAKSQVYGSPLVGLGKKYDLVGDALQVAVANQQLFWNDLSAIMEEDDFDPQYKVIGTIPLQTSVNEYVNQGAGNSANRQFQFAGYDFNFSKGITATAGAFASGYCMPDGTIGTMVRNTPDAKAGTKTSDGVEWGIYEGLTRFGYPVEVREKSACGDNTAIQAGNHLQASAKTNWQFAVDFAVVLPFNSDPATLPGGIKKFDFLNV